MKIMIRFTTVAAAFALVCTSPLTLAREHEEKEVNASDVPAAIQKAVEAEAQGGTVVRWEKEGKNYEAVIEKNGKQIGVELNSKGRIVSRHDETKEHKEKGEKE